MFDLIEINWVTVLLSQTAALTTIVTAWVAYHLYEKSKDDILQNAARILVLEIRESEKVIEYFKEVSRQNVECDDLIKVLPYKGWQKYSHLFIKKMNNDEYDQLNQYFKQCEVLENYIEKNHNFFWITTDERARQKEAIGAKLAYDEPTLKGDDFKTRVEDICLRYFDNTSSYKPVGIK
ncbi:MAG: hypothetical protein RLZZ230_93, partial [Candidatus Parcubacteria bacterium]